MGQLRISEIITIEDIKNWNKGEIVTITAGTGAGKSYFIKNILHAFAYLKNTKILMLVHRTNCKDQFLNEIKKDKKTDSIDIATYQSLEQKKGFYYLQQYDYIVCDEFHYFMQDAAFSTTTDISLDRILGQTDKVRIFMSATGVFYT
ncbi:DEAD/DEAH box helicase family protein [uncultured Clostridium sp.]|uniref:DEAD/DEAH box helicase family protein n=1 Tax=uncultured Clostridium sp. TaxID=59620 RepID=UPI00262FF5B0|nr:DEAD/DEAH box helicase family protein [uncultured Clostridium sp.]